MKILIVDQDGVALSFALRCYDAGHQVRWFVKPKKSVSSDTGNGFKGIEKIDNWVAHVSWADLRLCTVNDDYIEKMAFFATKGFPFFAPSPESAKLEISRKAGMEFLKSSGIECAESKVFATMEEAKRYVLKTGERFVFKTMGDNEDKSLTYVPESPADLIAWIDRTPPPKGEVMLQAFIKGIEMGVSRFMGSKGWVGQWNESFEHKKLMSGNYGPATGEMGTVAYFTETSKLGTETLGKLEKGLLKLGHRGDVAIGFMIDEKGKPWPTEFTCRLGWPIFNMMLGAIKGDPAQWMLDAMNGKDTTSFSEDIGVCLVLAHADFPHGNAPREVTHGVPIYGVTRGNRPHIHPQAVQILNLPDSDKEGKIKNSDMWATAGEYVAVITGFGKNVSQATKRAYKTAEELHVANPILRDDIGEELKNQLPKLHSLGYALGCTY